MVSMTTRVFKRTSSADVFGSVADDIDEVDAASAASHDAHPSHDTSSAATEPDSVARRRWVRYAAAGVAGLTLVAGVGSSGFGYWRWHQQNQIDRASAAALSTAQQFAIDLTSMDSGKVDENFNRVVSGSTGSFKDAYTQSASQLRQVLIDNRAASRGTVIDSAVKSAARNRVQILLFVDQWITNASNPRPRLDRSRVAITMTLVDNRWLASDVELK